MNSETTMFNPTAFLDATISEAFTERPALPPGDYPATIADVTQKSGTRKDGQGSWYSLNVQLTLDLLSDEAERLGQPPVVTLYDGVFLDLTPAGALDTAPGKNRRLKAYREAIGMNTSGKPFGPRMLVGRQVLIKVSNEMYEGRAQERIDGVAAIG